MSHGKTKPQDTDTSNMCHGSSSNMHVDDNHQSMNTYETMVEDTFGHNHRYECQTTNMDPNANEPPDPNVNEAPNPEA